MILRARGRTISFPRRPLVMGILNINDDSFSGDGALDPAWARRRAEELIAEGADIVDVGAESARTNRQPVSEDEELARLTPFLESWQGIANAARPADADQLAPPLLSINTWRPRVARAALGIAGDILNDMGGLPDAENATACAKTGAALLIMHTVGEPKIPHTDVRWRNVIGEMLTFFEERIALARSAGVAEDAIVLDPGIDFAKQREDNLRVFRELPRIAAIGRPVLMPVSRKGVIGDVLDLPNPADRDAGTVACIVSAITSGASIVRVHDVRAARQTILTIEAVLAE